MDHQPFIIAIADDHKMTRSVIRSILTNNNYKVCIAADSGEDLLDGIEYNGQLPDACIIDINMPGMDGFETVKWLKYKWPSVKVLAISADESIEPIVRIIAAGADGFVTKNSSIEELTKAIKKLFQ